MLEGNRSDLSIAVFGEKSPNTAVVLASALELAVLSRKRFPKLFVVLGGAKAEADPLRTKFEAAGARFEFLEYGPKQ